MVPAIATWWTTSAATGTTCCLSSPAPVVVTQAFLDYVYNGDSDMSVWIGTKPAGHNTLSDAFLASIAPREDNNTTLTTSRWAVFNAANRCGNVVVISASASDTTPEDTFKIHKLHFGCCGGGTPTPAPTPTPTPTPTPVPTATPTPTCVPVPSLLKEIRRHQGRRGTSEPIP